MTIQQSIDEAKLQDFLGKVVTDTAAACMSATCVNGY